MSRLKKLIGRRAVTREDWFLLADRWMVQSDYTLQSIAPADVGCKLCWDNDICAECLGEYPGQCPAECGDGTCTDPSHKLTAKRAVKAMEELRRRHYEDIDDAHLSFNRAVNGLYDEVVRDGLLDERGRAPWDTSYNKEYGS